MGWRLLAVGGLRRLVLMPFLLYFLISFLLPFLSLFNSVEKGSLHSFPLRGRFFTRCLRKPSMLFRLRIKAAPFLTSSSFLSLLPPPRLHELMTSDCRSEPRPSQLPTACVVLISPSCDFSLSRNCKKPVWTIGGIVQLGGSGRLTADGMLCCREAASHRRDVMHYFLRRLRLSSFCCYALCALCILRCSERIADA